MRRLLLSRYIRLLLLAFLTSFGSSRQVEASANKPTVDLGYARYTGVVNEATNTTQFLGVRYAAPPTGSLRWRAPQPPASTAEVVLADTQPSPCYNTGTGSSNMSPFRNGTFRRGPAPPVGPSDESEDCLFLNVHTPGTQQPELLPVIVWIYGGGYAGGDASLYSGDRIIREAGGSVVFVAIQYRLGAFGFLAGKAMKQGGDLNVGLLDQQFALTWVQTHINKFGGDPGQVTIWGQSAGGGSVIQHIIANDGNTNPPLFRAAMTNSAYVTSQYNYNDSVPETIFKEFVSQTGCASSSNALECLRGKDVAALQSANSNLASSSFQGTCMFVPVVDGTLITANPTKAYRRGRLNGDRVLSFVLTHEGNLFVDQGVTDLRHFVAQLFPTFGQKEINATVAQYAEMGTPADRANAILSEAKFVCPTYSLLKAFPGRSFKGEFAIPPGTHGSDLSYLFPAFGQPSYRNRSFIDAFGQSFPNFAVTLDPNSKTNPPTIAPNWNSWGGKAEMLFNRTEDGAPIIKGIETSSRVLERCSFWESVSSVSGQ